MPARRKPLIPQAVTSLLGSPRFTSVLSMVALGVAFCTNAIRATMGWPGLLGALGCLVILAAASFIVLRAEIEWHGLLPISILIFVGWSALSVFWSSYQWETLAGVIYQLTFAFLGLYIALVRDAIQIVRVVGDVLRVLLSVSLALEVLSGLLIDMPIKFLGIQGNIALGGPIQGLFGTRNQLSIVALIAFVTFLVELRTRSVRRGTAVASIALAVVSILFAHSPVIAAVLVVVGLATLALYGLRKTPAHSRRYVQWALLVVSTVAIILGYIYRANVIDLLSARADFAFRYKLWLQIWQLIPLNQLSGWGWVGQWPQTVYPFTAIEFNTDAAHADGLNAFLDVYLQVGFIGLVSFVALVALALWRSWLLASNKRSVVYVWAPLVLVALLATSGFESSILVESGWLLLVVCAVKASQGLSWRRSLPQKHPVRPAAEGLG
ncbi:MAG: exopolysaccharide production protein [Leifsonia sp.]|nr:exopolysaccharide production protein [Leifsonia sp.]